MQVTNQISQSKPRLQSNAGYTLGEFITLHFTYYEQWSGRSFYGSKSGAYKRKASKKGIVLSITEKAVQIGYGIDPAHDAWLPISQLKREGDVVTVSAKFCYLNQGKLIG